MEVGMGEEMKYISVCSGIEAASVAWEPLGWEPVAFSEIEPFPAAVLKHRWPKTPNLGDMTKYEQWNIPSGSVDLLVGGTPCQSFSVAGLRKGLHDPRGGLMLTFLEIAQCLRPRWVVWENVPGVLSSNGGRDFGSFLGALGELGYGWSYRVLDAQWFGVAQRRRRVFVVGHLGNWELAAKVLFESEGVRRDSPPSREAGQGASANAQEGVGAGGIAGGFRMQAFGKYSDDGTASAMKAWDYKDATDLVAEKKSHWEGSGVHPTLNQSFNTGAIGYSNQELFSQGGSGLVQSLYENHPNDSRVTGPHEVAPSCVSRFGTGGGNVPLVQEAIAFEPGIATREGSDGRFVKELSPTLRKEMGDNQVAVAVDTYNQALQETAVPIRSTASDICHTGGVINPKDRMAVRRLTPRECERLQGFPDDHTLIPWRNKPADQCPDGPRYKALGNSMAVPCMAWIGKRIDAADRENRKANQ
jgi:DNA (cytosine-5)-methyltransferase 1